MVPNRDVGEVKEITLDGLAPAPCCNYFHKSFANFP